MEHFQQHSDMINRKDARTENVGKFSVRVFFEGDKAVSPKEKFF